MGVITSKNFPQNFGSGAFSLTISKQRRSQAISSLVGGRGALLTMAFWQRGPEADWVRLKRPRNARSTLEEATGRAWVAFRPPFSAQTASSWVSLEAARWLGGRLGTRVRYEVACSIDHIRGWLYKFLTANWEGACEKFLPITPCINRISDGLAFGWPREG
jgi:hypothetical protein